MGSGATSGSVSFPSYIQDFHEEILWEGAAPTLSTHLDDEMDASIGNPPYADAGPPDIEDVYDSTLDVQREYSEAINTEPGVQWDNAFSAVDGKSKPDFSSAEGVADSEIQAAVDKAEVVANSSLVTNSVDQFETRAFQRVDKRKRAIASYYADANAVSASSFIVANALLEEEASKEVADFESELKRNIYSSAIQNHVNTFGNAVQLQQNYLLSALQSYNQKEEFWRNLRLEAARSESQAATSLYESELAGEEFSTELDEKTALWDLQVFERGANILAAPSGMAARLPEKRSAVSRSLGGALQGGAAGAKVGSAFGNPAIGAGVGALLGGVGQAFA